MSTAIALQTDFPFQTVYKERFNPSVLTKCTNISDYVNRAWQLHIEAVLIYIITSLTFSKIENLQFHISKVACLDNKVD